MRNLAGFKLDTIVKVVLSSETYDTGNDFDSATNYRFTAPASGYYLVSATMKWFYLLTNKIYTLFLYKNGSAYSSSKNLGGDSSQISCPLSDIVYLEKDDYLELYCPFIR